MLEKKKQQQKTQTKQTLSLSCNINRNAWTNALQPNQELEILEKLQAATTSQNCFNIFSIIIKTVWTGNWSISFPVLFVQ